MTNHVFFMAKAYAQAFDSYKSGGVPVGSVLVRGGEIIGQGHNQRVQQSDPIAHGEMDCLRKAGGNAATATRCSTRRGRLA